jgi:SAM-dependent methyltransferase
MHADPGSRWLAAHWRFVRSHLPAPPARVLEIGCGPRGGFVPALQAAGYAATGVDPEAPDEPGYHRIRFEEYLPPEPVDAVVACTSLHHVADLDDVLDRIGRPLAPGGTLVVVEWAWELFDGATARWCFARLPPVGPDEAGWLHRHRDRWAGSGVPWEEYARSWAEAEGLHPGERILAGLDARFHPAFRAATAYFFAELAGTTEADEQAAIERGDLRPNGIRFVGRRR